MCGIIGAISDRDVTQELIEGLHQLEYRGYDSAGIAILNEKLYCVRQPGRVENLEGLLKKKPISGNVGIAHTRWATHGAPDEINAHPHVSQERIAIVHNGVIENHEELRKHQIAEGFEFASNTDTEVIAHQIVLRLRECEDGKGQDALLRAVWMASKDLVGSYAIGVLDVKNPDRIVATRAGSPLLIGIGDEGNYVSSDMQALRGAQQFIQMNNDEVASITATEVAVYDADLKKIKPKAQAIPKHVGESDKGDYPHYMLKEIYEQPRVVTDALEGRIGSDTIPDEVFGPDAPKILPQVRNVQIVACGSSYHAGLVAKYWLEELVGVPCWVEIASEFRYRSQTAPEGTLLIAISQSGETADTLAAHTKAKERGYLATLAVCNVAQSSLVREADMTLLTHAGPEIGVASTKAFTAQLIAQLIFAIALTKHRPDKRDIGADLIAQLLNLPNRLEQVFELNDEIKALAAQCANKEHMLFLGRGQHYPIALEGALKMKEISYIHAEGYPAGELKHGPLALVDENMPVVAVAPNDHLLKKLQTNLSEVEVRGGQLYVFVDAQAHDDFSSGMKLIKLNALGNAVAPIIFNLPLQLLAYHAAVIRGTDVDKPRNLAKSVTVE